MLRIKPSSTNTFMSVNTGRKNSSNINFKGSSLLWKPIIAICEKTEHNPALLESAIGCVFASFLRPITILSIPGVKKEDKEYAAGKALISGFLGLAFSAIFYIPINMVVNKIMKGGMTKAVKLLDGTKVSKKLVFPFPASSTQA
ncbi:MAG: hypothetical protein WC197_08355, partial [Candidatus Gastranaerophilaceae bacterium]